MPGSFARRYPHRQTWAGGARKASLVALLLVGLGLPACDAGNPCTTGTAQCSCRTDNTCNDGLACVANRCTKPTGDAGADLTVASDTASPSDGRDGVAVSRGESADSASAGIGERTAAADATLAGGDFVADGPLGLGDLPDAFVGASEVRAVDSPTGTMVDTRTWGAETAGGTDSADAGLSLETSKCATGQVRVHVRDMWSHALTPTMDIMTDPPIGLILTDDGGTYETYGARADSAVGVDGGPCTYYSACIPNTVTALHLEPIHPSGCPSATTSGILDVSAVNRSGEYWIEYTGSSSSLKNDFIATPNLPQGLGKFHLTTDSATLTAPACMMGIPPAQPLPQDYIEVHFRWPYTDPVKTGYPGAACGDDQMGYSPPPYPTSLNAQAGSCARQALLDLDDGKCLWYSLIIGKSDLTKNADTLISFAHPNYLTELQTPEITLPTLSAPLRDEYWIVYTGATNSVDASVDACFALRYLPSAFSVLSENPGPEYPGCGEPTGTGQTPGDGGLGADGALGNDGGSVDCGAVNGSCCPYVCTVGAPSCASSTSIGTCALAAGGCTSVTETSTCASGLVCGFHDSPVCFDADWAAWPMPNSPADVAAGAPNPASLTDNGDGTVTDNVTQLMWQQNAPITNQRFSWNGAVSYCRALTLGRYSDWRLPSQVEYWSLIDFDRQNPSIDTAFFPGATSTWFWTSTARASSPGGYIVVGLFNGSSGSESDLNNVYQDVRCVRH